METTTCTYFFFSPFLFLILCLQELFVLEVWRITLPLIGFQLLLPGLRLRRPVTQACFVKKDLRRLQVLFRLLCTCNPYGSIWEFKKIMIINKKEDKNTYIFFLTKKTSAKINWME